MSIPICFPKNIIGRNNMESEKKQIPETQKKKLDDPFYTVINHNGYFQEVNLKRD